MDRPRQDRSRATLGRLLEAAQEVLTEVGAERATMAMICKRAGLTTGAVYRRFPGKDALLRHVYATFIDELESRNANVIAERVRAQSLDELARALVTGIVSQYRAHAGFLRALVRYAETADARFRRKFRDVNDASFRMICELLLAHRKEIRHRDPATAVKVAVSMVYGIERMVLSGEDYMYLSDEKLAAELTAMMLAYLTPPAAAPAPRGAHSVADAARRARRRTSR